MTTDLLNLGGAVGTLLMGLLGLLLPKSAARFVGLQPLTPAGRSEFRATYGGLWSPLALMPLLTQDPIVFAVSGLCWAGAAVGRIVSILLDDALDAQNLKAVGFELVLAALLLVGDPGRAVLALLG
jgi:hypothetical protein